MGQPQYLTALDRANKVRLARADTKRRVKIGATTAADVILGCSWEVTTMPVFDILKAQWRWGQTRCRRFLFQIPMSEKKTIGSLTDRQRETLAMMLRRASR
jgi:hypothetical protein